MSVVPSPRGLCSQHVRGTALSQRLCCLTYGRREEFTDRESVLGLRPRPPEWAPLPADDGAAFTEAKNKVESGAQTSPSHPLHLLALLWLKQLGVFGRIIKARSLKGILEVHVFSLWAFLGGPSCVAVSEAGTPASV